MFLSTGWDWPRLEDTPGIPGGIFQGSCAGGSTLFSLPFSPGTQSQVSLCGAVGRVGKSSNPQEKLFPAFCWSLGGIIWGFFPCFPPFFHGRGGFLSPCLSHLRLAAQFELEKQKFTFHSCFGRGVFVGNCWVLVKPTGHQSSLPNPC